VTQLWHHMGIRLALVFVGLFGVAFAIAGLLVGLPSPAVGGTCGPGTSSESAIVAFFDPGSIGAGAEPAATNATDRADWMAFVGECQASADSRVLGTFAILIVAIGIAAVGIALALDGLRRAKLSGPLTPAAPQPGPPPAPRTPFEPTSAQQTASPPVASSLFPP
jgi:hypothetical protein